MEPDRRQDRATAATIIEALRMKTAFGDFAARQLLKRCGIPPVVADRALASRHDQRQLPDLSLDEK
jgi:hypothetical protein